MTPRYLANPIGESVLAAIDAFDPSDAAAYRGPFFIIDARGDAEEFRSELGPRLVLALCDKVRIKNVEYVSGLGTRGRQFAVGKLKEHFRQLDQGIRGKAKSELIDLQSGKAKHFGHEPGTNFQSGIAIKMPVLGVQLHYDTVFAAQLA
jgi:hypothetical protein